MGLLDVGAVTLLVLLSVSPVWARPSWYDDENKGKYGWYGYEPDKQSAPEEIPAQASDQSAARVTVAPAPTVEWPSYEEAMAMRPEELGKYLKEAGAEAFRNPEDEEMMLRWAQYMAVTRVKSSQFAQANSYIMLQHPELAYQEATEVIPGLRAMTARKWQKKSDYLKSMARDFGLLLFVQQGGGLNEMMVDVLEGFQSYFDWEYRVVDVEENPVLARVVGVSKIPQVFLIATNNEFSPRLVATGPTTALSLAETVYRVMQMELAGRTMKDFAAPAPTVIDFEVR